jgi:sugar phosphate isomerase/epimerase
LNTCFAVKRWPEPEVWSRIAADLGVGHVQFSFDLLDPVLVDDEEVFAATRAICERNDVRISSAFTGLISYVQNSLGHPNERVRERARRWYEAAIDATATLGARGVGGHIGALSVQDFTDPAQRVQAVQRTVEIVQRLAERAAEKGLDFLLWEVMPVAREFPSRLDDTEELMARLHGSTGVPVELCIDMGHACAAATHGEDHDPYAWLQRLGHFTQVVHLQQTDGKVDCHWPFTDEFNRQGIVDPNRVVDLVAGFDRGSVELMLEPMFPFEAPDDAVLAAVGESVRYWQPALHRLGDALAPGAHGDRADTPRRPAPSGSLGEAT